MVYVKTVKLLSSFIYEDVVERPTENAVITSSISYMKEHLKRNLQVKDMVAEKSLSVSHFSYLFRKRTGFSPMQFFINLKLQQSCQYLYFRKLDLMILIISLGSLKSKWVRLPQTIEDSTKGNFDAHLNEG